MNDFNAVSVDDLKESYGFSLESYRKANMVRLYLQEGDTDPVCIFKAYYKGTFEYTCKLNFGSFNEGIMGALGGMFGPGWRSAIRGASAELVKQGVINQPISGQFAAPLKPYIKGTEPLTFTLNCFLPLIDKGDGTDTYNDNIEKWVRSILAVAYPGKMEEFKEVKNNLKGKIKEGINWLFSGMESGFWKAVQGAVEQMKDDFFGGIFVMTDPVQYRVTDGVSNSIALRIGDNRIKELVIDTVKVSYGPRIYSDGKRVYPAYCNVDVTCATKNPFTLDMLGLTESDIVKIC